MHFKHCCAYTLTLFFFIYLSLFLSLFSFHSLLFSLSYSHAFSITHTHTHTLSLSLCTLPLSLIFSFSLSHEHTLYFTFEVDWSQYLALTRRSRAKKSSATSSSLLLLLLLSWSVTSHPLRAEAFLRVLSVFLFLQLFESSKNNSTMRSGATSMRHKFRKRNLFGKKWQNFDLTSFQLKTTNKQCLSVRSFSPVRRSQIKFLGDVTISIASSLTTSLINVMNGRT